MNTCWFWMETLLKLPSLLFFCPSPYRPMFLSKKWGFWIAWNLLGFVLVPFPYFYVSFAAGTQMGFKLSKRHQHSRAWQWRASPRGCAHLTLRLPLQAFSYTFSLLGGHFRTGLTVSLLHSSCYFTHRRHEINSTIHKYYWQANKAFLEILSPSLSIPLFMN